MKALEVSATWDPRPGSMPHPRDKENVWAKMGSRAWRYPKVSVIRKQRPVIRKSTEILMRIRACGLCGSDVHMVAPDKDGYMEYPFMIANPHIPGHEFCGEVVAWGKEVPEFKPELAVEGLPITTQCVMPCMKCEECGDGDIDICKYVEERGLTQDGGMAEYCVVDAVHTFSLAPMQHLYTYQGRVSEDRKNDLWVAGSLIEPLANVYKALMHKENDFRPGQSVLIIGAGPIGLSALLMAKAMGAGTVLVAEVERGRRVYANKIGATKVFCPVEEKLSDVVLEETHGRGVDIVFEASGHAEKNWEELTKIQWAQQAVPRMLFFGQSRKALSFDPQLMLQKFAVFTGLHGHTKAWRPVIQMVGEGRIDPLSLSTKRISLEEAPQWLEILRTDKREGKVTIVFP